MINVRNGVQRDGELVEGGNLIGAGGEVIEAEVIEDERKSEVCVLCFVCSLY